MAIVQINDPNRRGTGHRFGEELGQGIEALVGHKMQQMNRQRQEQNNYEALIAGGMEPNQARGFSKASPEVIRDAFADIFSRYSTAGITKPNGSQTVSSEPQQSLQSQQIPSSKTQELNPQADLLQKLLGNQSQQHGQMNPQQALMQALQGGSLNGDQGLIDYLKDQQLRQPQSPQLSDMNQQQNVMPTQKAIQPQAAIPPRRPNPNLEQAERHHIEKMERSDIKERRPIIKEIVEKKRANEKRTQALERMKRHNAENTLDDPLYVGVLQKLGLNNIKALLTPGSQDFEGQVANFLDGLKSVFGARPTNFDVMTYLSKIPGLLNSPQGRELLINNWQKLIQADDAFDDERLSILRENPKGVPADLDLMAYENTKAKIDKIYDKFEAEAQRIVSGEPLFKIGSKIDLKQSSSLPKGTTGKVNGKNVIWNGKAWENA